MKQNRTQLISPKSVQFLMNVILNMSKKRICIDFSDKYVFIEFIRQLFSSEYDKKTMEFIAKKTWEDNFNYEMEQII